LNLNEAFGNRALLVYITFSQSAVEDDATEFHELVCSAGLECIKLVIVKRHTPDSHFFIGKGKAEELLQELSGTDINVVIFNQSLSPSQERNLEQYLNVRVIDRIGLILDIFAQRARSYEGKLQVELAQLQHLSTRLIRGWTHLERQKGGIGLRGPGETQLETDRRLIGKRIISINARLGRVRQQRQQGRRQRQKNAIPVVSFVGYTNAGKSTLFNRLTGAGVYVADQLFVTLDPTLRSFKLNSGRQIILTDTVGFISDLPHDLIESFTATLEEVQQADLLVHVIDISDEDQRKMRTEQVNKIIEQISASHIPQIEVYNKIDRIPEMTARTDVNESACNNKVWLSAKTGAGVDQLLYAIDVILNTSLTPRRLQLPPTAGQLRARLFDLGVVRQEESHNEGGWIVNVEMDDKLLHQLCRDADLDMSNLQYGYIHQ